MNNPREQVLGQFGSVTGPAKVLEVFQDGGSFAHAVNAGRHLWKALPLAVDRPLDRRRLSRRRPVICYAKQPAFWLLSFAVLLMLLLLF